MTLGSNMKVRLATTNVKSQSSDKLLCELHNLHLSVLLDADIIQPYLLGTLPPVSLCYHFDVLILSIRYRRRHEV